MSDPQNPQYPQPEQPQGAPSPAPGYGAPPAYTPPPAYDPAAGQPGAAQYGAPAPGYGPPPPPEPAPAGQTLGIVAFVLSFFVQLVALILGIIALVQSRRAGAKNGWAVAAIIISAVLIVVGIIAAIALFAALGPLLFDYARLCAEYGPGRHVVDGWTVTCPSQ